MSDLVICDGHCYECHMRNNCPLPSDLREGLARRSLMKNNDAIDLGSPTITTKDVMFDIQGSLFNFIQSWEMIHSSGDKINKKEIMESIMSLFPYEIDDIPHETRKQFCEIIEVIAGKIFLIVTGDCKASKEECYHYCLKEYCSQITRARLGKPIIT